jgi:hypothetical protein
MSTDGPRVIKGCADCPDATLRLNGGLGATTCERLNSAIVAYGKSPTGRPERCPLGKPTEDRPLERALVLALDFMRLQPGGLAVARDLDLAWQHATGREPRAADLVGATIQRPDQTKNIETSYWQGGEPLATLEREYGEDAVACAFACDPGSRRHLDDDRPRPASLADLYRAALIPPPGHRPGQAMFNALKLMRPALAEEIRGTDCDPFHAGIGDPKFTRALERIEAAWSRGQPDRMSAAREVAIAAREKLSNAASDGDTKTLSRAYDDVDDILDALGGAGFTPPTGPADPPAITWGPDDPIGNDGEWPSFCGMGLDADRIHDPEPCEESPTGERCRHCLAPRGTPTGPVEPPSEKHWRPLPGMRLWCEELGFKRVADEEIAAGVSFHGWLPDREDPATLGCLRALEEESSAEEVKRLQGVVDRLTDTVAERGAVIMRAEAELAEMTMVANTAQRLVAAVRVRLANMTRLHASRSLHDHFEAAEMMLEAAKAATDEALAEVRHLRRRCPVTAEDVEAAGVTRAHVRAWMRERGWVPLGGTYLGGWEEWSDSSGLAVDVFHDLHDPDKPWLSVRFIAEHVEQPAFEVLAEMAAQDVPS